MIIGQVGWSGNKNWGDERILWCMKKFFQGDEIRPFTMWQEDIKKLNQCDFILIGGGGLISRGFNYYADQLSKFNKPFGCVGISVEAEQMNPDMARGVEFIKKHAEFIYVRDKKSKELFGHHHKVMVAPDITFLFPYPTVSQPRQTTLVNLRDWPWWDVERFSRLDHYLENLDKHVPWFKSVYPFKTWNVDALMALLHQQRLKLKPLPLYFGANENTDQTYMQKYFKSLPLQPSTSLFAGARLLVGMRLHSTIFAAQMGIPFISLAYEPKNERFCQEIGLPELALPLKDYSHLPEKLEYITQHRKHIREALRNYTEYAKIETHRTMTAIRTLMHKP